MCEGYNYTITLHFVLLEFSYCSIYILLTFSQLAEILSALVKVYKKHLRRIYRWFCYAHFSRF